MCPPSSISSSSSEEQDHNEWCPLLELFFHWQIGQYMEAMADEVSTAKWRLRVISRSMCCAKNEPAAGTVPLGGQVVEFFLADMSDASCQDLQAISVVSGGGETECIHGSVRCLAAKVTGRGCHLPLDPLHVQISKIQTAIGMAGYTVETCSEQVCRSQEVCMKAQDHLWILQCRLDLVALRKEEEDQGYVAMALGGMQTHQAPTTCLLKVVALQYLIQSGSVEGCAGDVSGLCSMFFGVAQPR